MILSGHEILAQLGTNLVIDPFDEANLNPNSYNLSLHDELMVYEEVVLDMAKANRVRRIPIPRDGIVLSPNQLYLGRTASFLLQHGTSGAAVVQDALEALGQAFEQAKPQAAAKWKKA